MKYAFMSFSCPEASLDELFQTAEKFGFDGIEPRIQSNQGHGIEFSADAAQREKIRKEAEAAGATICCLATSCKFADPAESAQHVADANAAIDLAGDIGVTRIRVFGGHLGEEFEDNYDKAIAYVAEQLLSLADHAADRGVTVCMETHDSWCDPSHVAAVMEKADHPNIQVNWDILHPVRRVGYSIEDAYRLLKPYIRHVHVHDYETNDGPFVPIGEGIADHRTAIKLLKADGYDGFISGEWIRWEPAETHLPRELATLKAYEAEA